MRGYTIYVSGNVHAMLKAKAAVDTAAGGNVCLSNQYLDALADSILQERLMQEPYMAEYLRLQKESRDNFERSVAELVKAKHGT